VDFLGNNDQDGGCITEVVETTNNKRRSTGVGGRTDVAGTPQNRRPKHPAYFIPELAHVVALCDERIPFVTLAQEVRFYLLIFIYSVSLVKQSALRCPYNSNEFFRYKLS